ncbi:MAG TPA: 16S rRNA (adenine(1518)-N(6)/adenine(1519)-N(6))-dimethyltransferase RsmA [Candidatus Sulfotelmatobacter sp.]|nr:16S rRNA (adenine(1518)-N(6)/adenine(1519)-N(6))-dimethyltransferase RsmA [Candidatus Sulfotelmatobacter sp.]
MATSVLYRPLKRLGQNFLLDKRVATRVVSAAGLSTTDTVLEPGAGYGTLTRLLEVQAGRVIAVEKDRRLAAHLRSEFRNSQNIEVIEGDVLEISLPTFNKVVGTPPYALSSKLILFLTKKKFELASLVFQKEFGERLLAEPGTADYGRLSIAAQRSLTIQPIMNISAASFRPRPKVDSILLRISPKEVNSAVNQEQFEELVRGLFNQRKRVVRSSFLHFLSKKMGRERARSIMKEVILPEKRVFQLTISDLEELRQQLSKALESQDQPTA